MRETGSDGHRKGFFGAPLIALVLVACGGTGPAATVLTPGPTSAAASVAPGSSDATSSEAPSATEVPSPSEAAVSAAPSDAGEGAAGAAHGDVPDNAVFLTYHSTTPPFSIQYVEGWQVTPQADGVVIRDKDSSETVAVVASPADVAQYIASVDLPALQAMTGFKLKSQDTVKVGGSRYPHLVYHLPAPPDPVTGKQVPSTVDRYYVPGPAGLAIVSLATPNGVDNVDAFRQMITSLSWS